MSSQKTAFECPLEAQMEIEKKGKHPLHKTQQGLTTSRQLSSIMRDGSGAALCPQASSTSSASRNLARSTGCSLSIKPPPYQPPACSIPNQLPHIIDPCIGPPATQAQETNTRCLAVLAPAFIYPVPLSHPSPSPHAGNASLPAEANHCRRSELVLPRVSGWCGIRASKLRFQNNV